ncbi:MAG: tyrosine-type recombinase/integrase [Microbacteriaceae bacterium]
MAAVERRQQRRRDGSLGPVTYRVTWRDPARRQRSKTFSRKADAERFARSIEVDKDRGQYIDPDAGAVTFDAYADRWLAGKVIRPSSLAALEDRLAHARARLGPIRLRDITRSDVQAFVRALAATHAPTTVTGAYRVLSSVMTSAVEDRMIVTSPCRRIDLPRSEHGQIEPLRVDQVHALIEAADPRWRAYFVLLAGCGLRQGEAFGLTVDRVDFLRRTVRVDRQLVHLTGAPRLAPPKTPAAVRNVPLPSTVADELARHLERYGEGQDRLVFSTTDRRPITRGSSAHWIKMAVRAAGLPPSTSSHDLRHFYASALIAAGQSVKVIQARLGHRSAVETLDVYGHLWPDSEDETIVAVDALLAPGVASLLPERVAKGRFPS